MVPEDRAAILKAHSIGPRMVQWLEEAGYLRLADFREETPEGIAMRMEALAGVRMNGNGINALRNLVALAREAV
jgi:hypothetical protein